MPPSRRRVLALTGTLLTAGCVETTPGSPASDTSRGDTESPPRGSDSSPGSNESPEPSEQRPVTETSDCTSGITIETDPYAPVSQVPIDLGERERSLVATAASEGSAAYETYGQSPLRADVIVSHDGAFYRTDYSETNVEEVPAYTMDVYWEHGQTAPAGTSVVAFEDLPAADRDALGIAALGPEDGDREGGEGGDGLPQETLSINEFPAPYPDDGTDSRLIGTRTWVRWRDRTLRVDVAGESTGTQERRTYRYTLDRVADDEAAFRQFIAEAFLVELTDLPDDQRSILSKAIEDGYRECLPESDGLSALRDRLADGRRLPHPYDRSWYVAFEGQRYRLQLLGWVH